MLKKFGVDKVQKFRVEKVRGGTCPRVEKVPEPIPGVESFLKSYFNLFLKCERIGVSKNIVECLYFP